MLSLTRAFIQNQLIDATHQYLTYIRIPEFDGGTSGESAPLKVDSTYVVTNLNADMLDGYHVGSSGSKVPLLSGTNIWSGQQTITSNLIVDTNTLYVDAVNHRVGIGTSNPFDKLTLPATGRVHH